ncbi:MAG: GatB/YqeY domain-containing protein [Bacteroidales bacterium]
MNLFDKISEDIKKSMLAKDKLRTETLRGVKKEFIEAKTAKGAEGDFTDEQAIKILQKMQKQRKDAAEIFETQNRADLAEKEILEVAIIAEYLPQPMSEQELEAAVLEIIKECGATSAKEMGKVMGAASKALSGKSDGKAISAMVKKLLS